MRYFFFTLLKHVVIYGIIFSFGAYIGFGSGYTACSNKLIPKIQKERALYDQLKNHCGYPSPDRDFKGAKDSAGRPVI